MIEGATVGEVNYNREAHERKFEDWIVTNYEDLVNTKIVYQAKYDLCIEILVLQTTSQLIPTDSKYRTIKQYIRRHKLTLLNIIGML